jgi:hypothetical protein
LGHGRSGEQEQIQQAHAGIVAENIRRAEDVSEELNGGAELRLNPVTPDSSGERKLYFAVNSAKLAVLPM